MPVKAATFRRRRLSLTSLIDVIFLLLLFFMLSSTFSRHGEIAFLAASQGSGGSADRPPLFLRLDGDALTLNGVSVTLGNLVSTLLKHVQDDPAPRLVVAVTGDATSQALVDVLVPLGQVRGAEVTVVE